MEIFNYEHMDIIFIIGLPGSGKTHLGNKIRSETGYKFIDDPFSFNEIKESILKSENLIISDPHLCNPKVLKKAVEKISRINPLYKFRYYYFENDAIKCVNNVSYRNDGHKAVDEFIRHMSKIYKIPSGVTEIKIWQNER